MQADFPKTIEESHAISLNKPDILEYRKSLENEVSIHLADPRLLFAADETMVAAGLKKVKVFQRTDVKAVKKIVSNEANALHITLTLITCADGSHVLPHVILPLAHFLGEFRDHLAEFAWSGSETGWTNKQVVFDLMRRVFVPHVISKREKAGLTDKWAYLIVDGHASRDNAETVKLKDNKIHLITILPNSGPALDPLDCGTNGSFKQKFAKESQGIKNLNLEGRRVALFEAIKKFLHGSLYPGDVKKTFLVTGWFPWDATHLLSGPYISSEPFAPREKKRGPNISGRVLTADIHYSEMKVREEEAKKDKEEKEKRKTAREEEKKKKKEEKERKQAEKDSPGGQKQKRGDCLKQRRCPNRP